MKLQPEMILMDVDGTLVDSVPDLAYCVDETLRRLGRPVCGESAVRHWVGNGVQRLVERALVNDLEGVPEPALLERALPVFMALYAENTSLRSRLYPGVQEGLDYLRTLTHIRLGTFQNKARQFTLPLLTSLGLMPCFEIVICGDTLAEKKPHPMPLLHACEQLDTRAENSLMLGDSRSDVTAARRAGFHVFCMSYGYNHGEDIRAYHPDAVLDSMVELRELIR